MGGVYGRGICKLLQPLLYGYMDTGTISKGKTDEIIKTFLLKINM